MKRHEIYNSAQMIELIQEIGFLPLLDSGISGYSGQLRHSSPDGLQNNN